MFGMLVGTFCSFVMGIFNPYVVNKAGPWMWGGGRDECETLLPPRRHFPPLWPPRPDALFGGSAAVFWML